MNINLKKLIYGANAVRRYGVQHCRTNHRCKLLVVGGGTGGCSIAWRFARKLKGEDIIVVEPSQIHYYQPQFTLVAAGISKFKESHRPQKSVLPKDVTWIQDRAVEFDPCNCVVHTCGGDKISYDYMVVAVGLVNDYDRIPGLKEALDNPTSGVSTIYASEYCEKTWRSIRSFRGGHAVFTFPRTAGKCSGAAQKIMYLADDYWRKHKIRHLANITYATAGNAIFGVEKYATALMGVASNRCIAVNYCLELVELTCVGAVFVDSAGQTIILPYNLLHVTPPMSPPVDLRRCTELVTDAGYLLVDQHSLQHQLSANYKSTITLPYNLLHVTPPMSPPVDLRRCTELVTAAGYLLVDQHSLQHQRYGNVFGVGDCLCTPNSKTAAAVAQQTAVVEQNLTAVMQGMEPIARYNGYGACPLLTSYSKGILAEFVYDKKPWETFPFDQSKERRLFYHVKTKILPYIYWKKMVTGKWDGPEKLRKILNPFGNK